LPDVYEQPFHRLDISFQQQLRHGFNLRFALTNLLNQSVVLKQGDIEAQRYALGISAAIGLEWVPERFK